MPATSSPPTPGRPCTRRTVPPTSPAGRTLSLPAPTSKEYPYPLSGPDPSAHPGTGTRLVTRRLRKVGLKPTYVTSNTWTEAPSILNASKTCGCTSPSTASRSPLADTSPPGPDATLHPRPARNAPRRPADPAWFPTLLGPQKPIRRVFRVASNDPRQHLLFLRQLPILRIYTLPASNISRGP